MDKYTRKIEKDKTILSSKIEILILAIRYTKISIY